MTAREVLVPAVARHTGTPLERLVGARQSLTSMALVIGPAAAGALLALFEGTTVLLVTAATSVAAALLTLAVPHRFGRIGSGQGRPASVWAQLVAGVAVLRRSRFLAGMVGLTVGLAVALGGLQGLVLPLYFSLVSRPDLLGLVLTALAAGMLAGAGGMLAGAGGMLAGAGGYAAVGARMPNGFWMNAGLAGMTAGFVLIATLSSPAVVFAGAVLVGVANALLGAVAGVLQAERVPEALRGRVLSLQNAFLQIAVPVGIGLAGAVAEYGSPVAAGFVVTAMWVVLVIAVVASRALTGLEPKETTVAQQ